MQLNLRDKELVSRSVHSPPGVSTRLVFLLTQTNKRQRTHIVNSVYRKRREEKLDHVSVWCTVGKKRLEKPAKKHYGVAQHKHLI